MVGCKFIASFQLGSHKAWLTEARSKTKEKKKGEASGYWDLETKDFGLKMPTLTRVIIGWEGRENIVEDKRNMWNAISEGDSNTIWACMSPLMKIKKTCVLILLLTASSLQHYAASLTMSCKISTSCSCMSEEVIAHYISGCSVTKIEFCGGVTTSSCCILGLQDVFN